MFGMYSYSSMRMPLWGLSAPCSGSGTGYLDSPVLNYGSWSRNNYVDADGWHYDSAANKELYVRVWHADTGTLDDFLIEVK